MTVIIPMFTADGYSKVVSRLDDRQVRMTHPPGVDTQSLDIIMERNGGQFCSGVTVDPAAFPEAVKFTVVVEK